MSKVVRITVLDTVTSVHHGMLDVCTVTADRATGECIQTLGSCRVCHRALWRRDLARWFAHLRGLDGAIEDWVYVKQMPDMYESCWQDSERVCELVCLVQDVARKEHTYIDSHPELEERVQAFADDGG
jgi:hypothetical protein